MGKEGYLSQCPSTQAFTLPVRKQKITIPTHEATETLLLFSHIMDWFFVYMTLFGYTDYLAEGKSPLGRPRLRWEDNIKTDLKEIGYESLDWIRLAEDKNQWWDLVNTVINIWVP